jgi:hypothetical protein
MSFNDTPDSPIDAGATILNQGLGEPGFQRAGPLITSDRIRDEYLWGIPLTAPLTGQVLTDPIIKQIIRKAIGDFEISVRIPVSPVLITDKFDYERADDIQFGTRQMTRWPLLQVQKLEALFPGLRDEAGNAYEFPTSWVTPQSDTGLIRIVPNSSSLDNGNVSQENLIRGRALSMFNTKTWPNVWRITYTAGFDFDKVPDIVNDCIGTMAAMRILSMISPVLAPIQSQGIGIDGLSQSTGGPGTQWFAERLQELTAERDRLIGQLKSHYGNSIVLSVW